MALFEKRLDKVTQNETNEKSYREEFGSKFLCFLNLNWDKAKLYYLGWGALIPALVGLSHPITP